MKSYYNPNRIDCRCGCLGVPEFHEAGERVRREMLGDRLRDALEPVMIGKRTNRPGFGRLRVRGVATIAAELEQAMSEPEVVEA